MKLLAGLIEGLGAYSRVLGATDGGQPVGKQAGIETCPFERSDDPVQDPAVGGSLLAGNPEGLVCGDRLGEDGAFVPVEIELIFGGGFEPLRFQGRGKVPRFARDDRVVFPQPLGHQGRTLVLAGEQIRGLALSYQGDGQQIFKQTLRVRQVQG